MTTRQSHTLGLLDDDTPSRPRHGGTRALVLIDRRFCPACGSPTTEQRLREPALFYFGGYGATRSSTAVHCTGRQCHWAMVTEVTETNPRHPDSQQSATLDEAATETVGPDVGGPS